MDLHRYGWAMRLKRGFVDNGVNATPTFCRTR